MDTNSVVVPFGVQYLQPMPVIEASVASATNTFTHTGIGDSGQDSETDSD